VGLLPPAAPWASRDDQGHQARLDWPAAIVSEPERAGQGSSR
jgi:hypothetical protein